MKSCQTNVLQVLVISTLLHGGKTSLRGADLDSVLSLSVLPLDKLLHVRRTLTQDNVSAHSCVDFNHVTDSDLEEIMNNLEDSGLPEALPLNGDVKKQVKDKTFGGYFEDDWMEDPWNEDPWKEDPWKEEVSWKEQFKNKLKEKFKEHFSKFHHKNKKKKNKKHKIQKIFQISITLLAFLAFGGYLVALVLLSMRQNDPTVLTTTITPIAQARLHRRETHISSENDMYFALRRLAEGYARYNEHCQGY